MKGNRNMNMAAKLDEFREAYRSGDRTLPDMATELRQAGMSYENIADALSQVRFPVYPWDAYEWTNPRKTAQQIEAWKVKHHSTGDFKDLVLPGEGR